MGLSNQIISYAKVIFFLFVLLNSFKIIQAEETKIIELFPDKEKVVTSSNQVVQDQTNNLFLTEIKKTDLKGKSIDEINIFIRNLESLAKQSNLPTCKGENLTKKDHCFGYMKTKVADGSDSFDFYEGEFKNNARNGKGVIYYNNGEKYIGEHNNDQKHGLGAYVWPDGAIHIGEHKNQNKHGHGTFFFPNGDQYVGMFKNDVIHGWGTQTYSDGREYTGEFKDWSENGMGTMTIVGGAKYVGMFKNGKAHGDGIYYYAKSSKKYVGVYKNGKAKGLGTMSENIPEGFMKVVGKFDINKKGRLLPTEGIITLNGEKISGSFSEDFDLIREYDVVIDYSKLPSEKTILALLKKQQPSSEEKTKTTKVVKQESKKTTISTKKEKQTDALDQTASVENNESKKTSKKQETIEEPKNHLELAKIIIDKFNLNETPESLVANIEFVEISNDFVKDYYVQYIIDEQFTKQIKDQDEELIDSFSKNHLIFYSTKKALTRRLVESRNFHLSSYLVGTQTIENPDYAKLALEINLLSRRVELAFIALENAKADAEEYRNEVRGRSCGGGWADFFCGMAESHKADQMVEGPQKNYDRQKNKYDSMSRRLASMPLTIDKEIFDKYQYNTSKVKSAKNSDIILHHVNLSTNKIQSVKIKNEEMNNFTMVYNLHGEDKDYDSIVAKYETENDVTNWERANLEISFAELIQNLNKNQITTSNFNSSNQITATIIDEVPKQIEETTTVSQSSEVVNVEYDDRFKSVVIVKNPSDGGFGSGFYIAPNLILTNYHVIEGSPNPGIQLFQQGYDVMGRVIATDLRLDLALVEIAYKGPPVEIASNLSIRMGAEVDAIGHPFGNHFTLTRGIISAIRESESTFSVGGKPVIYIQTDTAVNSGNSGGPLFINNVVVGVNTQVVRKDLAEGLNFAVHFKEINEFIKLNKK